MIKEHRKRVENASKINSTGPLYSNVM